MNETNLKIKKSHELVLAKYHLSLQESRLFCMVISMVDDRDEDFKTYKIPIKDLIDTFQIKSKAIYQEIKTLSREMIKKIVTLSMKENGVDKEMQVSLISSSKYNVNGKGLLEITFHPALKPHLLQLQNRYLLYDFKNVLKLSSGNSIRMYEVLKTYEGIKKISFMLDQLKEILGVSDKYHKYSNFKSRILLRAQKDLQKHTDISFTFDEIASNGGRKIDKLVFYISKNHGKTPLASTNQSLEVLE